MNERCYDCNAPFDVGDYIGERKTPAGEIVKIHLDEKKCVQLHSKEIRKPWLKRVFQEVVASILSIFE